MRLRDIALMLAKPSPTFSREGWWYSLKYDGIRVVTDKRQILTRKYHDATERFAVIARALSDIPEECVLDGEICALDDRGIPDFEALLRRSRQHPLALFVFDLLFLNGIDLRSRPYLERQQKLRTIIPLNHPRIRYVEPIEREGEVLYQYAISIGMEGVWPRKVTLRMSQAETTIGSSSSHEGTTTASNGDALASVAIGGERKAAPQRGG